MRAATAINKPATTPHRHAAGSETSRNPESRRTPERAESSSPAAPDTPGRTSGTGCSQSASPAASPRSVSSPGPGRRTGGDPHPPPGKGSPRHRSRSPQSDHAGPDRRPPSPRGDTSHAAASAPRCSQRRNGSERTSARPRRRRLPPHSAAGTCRTRTRSHRRRSCRRQLYAGWSLSVARGRRPGAGRKGG